MKFLKSLSVLGLSGLGLGVVAPTMAQEDFPSRPVQLVFPFDAGGADTLFRAFAKSLSTQLGQNVFVVNKSGASGSIGAGSVAKATPDGYTLMVGPSIVMANLPYVQKNLGYSVDSFDYVCHMASNPFVLATRARSPYKTLQDVIDATRKSPGTMSYGHVGRYTDLHLNGWSLFEKAKVDVVDVPYRGGAQATQALLAGDIPLIINSVIAVVGRNDLRPLAVFWDKRHPGLPDTPSTTELGYPVTFYGQQGLYAPKGTPPQVLAKLEKACLATLETDDFKAAAKTMQAVVTPMPGAEFRRSVKANYDAKGVILKALGVKPE